jgi:hypothetical protein
MLHNQVRTQLLSFRDGDMPVQPKFPGRIVDRNQPLPLLFPSVSPLNLWLSMLKEAHLDRQRLIFWYSKPHALALSVEGI